MTLACKKFDVVLTENDVEAVTIWHFNVLGDQNMFYAPFTHELRMNETARTLNFL